MAQYRRLYNRTVTDIGRQMIDPRARRLLQNNANNWVHFCKTNHSYQNRTRALENSISRSEVERTERGYQVLIEAGGLSSASFTFDAARRAATGKRKRMKRFGQQVGRGSQIYVDYAVFVEAKGFAVLLQGMEYIRARGIRGLQIMRLPDA